MLKPDGRVILVSGASRGIGRAIAERLYADGYSLSLGLREPKSAADWTLNWDPRRLHVARFDAANWATHAAWVAAAVERFGRLDGLINNAGVNSKVTLRNVDEAELDKVWAVNCKAPLNLIHLALPHLEACGSGRIVNVASLAGKRMRNDFVAYSMSKFAVMALTQAARRIAFDKGVRATALCPSFVRTDMTSYVTSVRHEDMTRPEDLAMLVSTLLALPNSAIVAELLVNFRQEDMV